MTFTRVLTSPGAYFLVSKHSTSGFDIRLGNVPAALSDEDALALADYIYEKVGEKHIDVTKLDDTEPVILPTGKTPPGGSAKPPSLALQQEAALRATHPERYIS